MRLLFIAGYGRSIRLTSCLIGAFLMAGSHLPIVSQSIRDKCGVCDRMNLSGGYFQTPHGPVCTECSGIPNRCSLCGLPAKLDFIQTQDGRIICRREAPHAVMNEQQARRILQETARGLIRLSGGQLAIRSPNLSVKVFDVDYWNVQNGEPVSQDLRRVGFTQTRVTSEQMFHSVLLWSGRTDKEIAGVCAHELTHVWINENKPREREIDHLTVEGICELVAYKYMQMIKDREQMENIEKNPYTRGKIQTLIAYEKRYGLKPLFHWVVAGRGKSLEMDGIYGFPELLKEQTAVAPTPTLSPSNGSQDPTPERLSLKGITITASGKMAIINNRLFRENETAEITLGPRKHTVTCVKIDEKSVSLKINNYPQLIVLRIGE